ncbi:hypothetical protein [Serratia sarumanii]|uniref:hypothetical protein n=1 Tax=Serratia sarumanii TaxID=3020826 RepID=UPI003F7EEDDF
MEIKGDFYVLMHSESQGCFHIEKMSVMLHTNLGIFLKGKTVDYLPLAIAATIDELQEIKARLTARRYPQTDHDDE